jgi:hypothetical protein
LFRIPFLGFVLVGRLAVVIILMTHALGLFLEHVALVCGVRVVVSMEETVLGSFR